MSAVNENVGCLAIFLNKVVDFIQTVGKVLVLLVFQIKNKSVEIGARIGKT